MKGGTPIVSRKTLRALGLDRPRTGTRLTSRQLRWLTQACVDGPLALSDCRKTTADSAACVKLNTMGFLRWVIPPHAGDGDAIETDGDLPLYVATGVGRAHVAKLLAVKVEVGK